MKRSLVMIGNWKMHHTAHETRQYMETFQPLIQKFSSKIGLAPPYTSLRTALEGVIGKRIWIGAQNMSEFPSGAYTGEISSTMIKEAGAQFVLLGHSERRTFFGEKEEQIHLKLQRALQEELTPVLCIGESAKEREEGITQRVLQKQLSSALHGINLTELQPLVLAYEPIWAIGTGKTATPKMAAQAHKICRDFLSKEYSKEWAEALPILYGGSVKESNIADLIKEKEINGALVGGASLDPYEFANIIQQ
ncbi:MAG: triose-phosphate isomerase, partial [Simkania negevensis]|nr:triose-phosphate isomerase [Simkania negevensis]